MQTKQHSDVTRAEERMKKICEQMIQDSKNTEEKKMENTSGIRPTEYKVLIKPKEAYEKNESGYRTTSGGIVVPDEVEEREQFAQMEGTIIDMSPWAFDFLRDDEMSQSMHWSNVSVPNIGNRVLYSKYSGSMCEGNDGEQYRLVSDKDIAAILED